MALIDNLTGAFQSFLVSSNMANNNLNYSDNVRVKVFLQHMLLTKCIKALFEDDLLILKYLETNKILYICLKEKMYLFAPKMPLPHVIFCVIY